MPIFRQGRRSSNFSGSSPLLASWLAGRSSIPTNNDSYKSIEKLMSEPHTVLTCRGRCHTRLPYEQQSYVSFAWSLLARAGTMQGWPPSAEFVTHRSTCVPSVMTSHSDIITSEISLPLLVPPPPNYPTRIAKRRLGNPSKNLSQAHTIPQLKG